MKLRSVVVLGVSILLAIVGFGWFLHARPEPEVVSAKPSPTSTEPAPSRAPTTTPTPTPGWRTTEEIRVYTGTVPPVPQLVGLRLTPAAGQTYDRLTLEFDQAAVPGYRIRPLAAIAQDGSGKPVTIPGSASYLEVMLEPTQAHTEAGQPSFANPKTSMVSGSAVLGYALTGDFEGRVTVGLGLRGPSAFSSSLERVAGRWVLNIDVRPN